MSSIAADCSCTPFLLPQAPSSSHSPTPPRCFTQGGISAFTSILMPSRRQLVSRSPSPSTQLPFPSTWRSTPSVCSALLWLMHHQFLHLLINQNIVLLALQEPLHVTGWCFTSSLRTQNLFTKPHFATASTTAWAGRK